MANINLPGPVGNYVETTTYNIGDIVRDTTNGRTWMSRIDNNTTTLPTDVTGSDQWQLLAADGAAGQVNTSGIAITIDRPDERTANPVLNADITPQQVKDLLQVSDSSAGVIVDTNSTFSISGVVNTVTTDGSITLNFTGGLTEAQNFVYALSGRSRRFYAVSSHPVILSFSGGRTFTLVEGVEVQTTGTTNQNLQIVAPSRFSNQEISTWESQLSTAIGTTLPSIMTVDGRANELRGGTDITITEENGIATVNYTGTPGDTAVEPFRQSDLNADITAAGTYNLSATNAVDETVILTIPDNFFVAPGNFTSVTVTPHTGSASTQLVTLAFTSVSGIRTQIAAGINLVSGVTATETANNTVTVTGDVASISFIFSNGSVNGNNFSSNVGTVVVEPVISQFAVNNIPNALNLTWSTVTQIIPEWEAGTPVADGQLYYYQPAADEDAVLWRSNATISAAGNTVAPGGINSLGFYDFHKVGEYITYANQASGATFPYGSIVIDDRTNNVNQIWMQINSTAQSFDPNVTDTTSTTNWVNLNQSGGGTTVAANPNTTSSDPALTSITIGDDNYRIEGSGNTGPTEIDDWSATMAYGIDDVVAYNNIIYRARQAISAGTTTSVEIPLDHTFIAADFQNYEEDTGTITEYIRINLETGRDPGTASYTLTFVFQGTTYSVAFTGSNVRIGGSGIPGTQNEPFVGDNSNWYVDTDNLTSTPAAPSGGFPVGVRPDNSSIHLRTVTSGTANTNPGADTTNWEQLGPNSVRAEQPGFKPFDTQHNANNFILGNDARVGDLFYIENQNEVRRITSKDGINVHADTLPFTFVIDATSANQSAHKNAFVRDDNGDIWITNNYVDNISTNTIFANETRDYSPVHVVADAGSIPTLPRPGTTTDYNLRVTPTTNPGTMAELRWDIGGIDNAHINNQARNTLIDIDLMAFPNGATSSNTYLVTDTDLNNARMAAGIGWARTTTAGTATAGAPQFLINFTPTGVQNRQAVHLIQNIANLFNQLVSVVGETNLPWHFTADNNDLVATATSDTVTAPSLTQTEEDAVGIDFFGNFNTGQTPFLLTSEFTRATAPMVTSESYSWAAATSGSGITAVTQSSEIPASPSVYNIIHINSASDVVDTSGQLAISSITGAEQLYHGGTTTGDRVVVNAIQLFNDPGGGTQIFNSLGTATANIVGSRNTQGASNDLVFRLGTVDTPATALAANNNPLSGRRNIRLSDNSLYEVGTTATNTLGNDDWFAFVDPSDETNYVILGAQLASAGFGGDGSNLVISDRAADVVLTGDVNGFGATGFDRVAQWPVVTGWLLWKLSVPAGNNQAQANTFFNSFTANTFWMYRPMTGGSSTNTWQELSW